jgi:hypothetical protein
MHVLTKRWLKTNRTIHKAREAIAKANEEIRKAQTACEHPGLRHRYGSNTGNYDPSSDTYWTDFYCNVCDAKWKVDGSIRAPNSISVRYGEELDRTLLTLAEVKALHVQTQD